MHSTTSHRQSSEEGSRCFRGRYHAEVQCENRICFCCIPFGQAERWSECEIVINRQGRWFWYLLMDERQDNREPTHIACICVCTIDEMRVPTILKLIKTISIGAINLAAAMTQGEIAIPIFASTRRVITPEDGNQLDGICAGN